MERERVGSSSHLRYRKGNHCGLDEHSRHEMSLSPDNPTQYGVRRVRGAIPATARSVRSAVSGKRTVTAVNTGTDGLGRPGGRAVTRHVGTQRDDSVPPCPIQEGSLRREQTDRHSRREKHGSFAKQPSDEMRRPDRSRRESRYPTETIADRGGEYTGTVLLIPR